MDELFDRIREEDGNRSVDGQREGGIFKVLFLKRSGLIIHELFPMLKSKLKSQSFQDAFIKQFRSLIAAKRDALLLDVRKCEEAGRDSRFYSQGIPALERQLEMNSLNDYLDFLRDPEQGHPGIVEILLADYAYLNGGDGEGSEFVSEYYHLYEIGTFLYERHAAKVALFERFERRGASTLRSIYKERDIDLTVSDPQFSKYGLLSFGEGFRIANNKESQTIVDEQIGLHYWIDVPRDVLAAIEAAMAEGWVKEIAFNVDGITEATPSFEDLEYGSLFSFDALQLPELSKLYDGECYDDALWIKMDKRKSSMTFEELYSDFSELDGRVITQVVHLELLQDAEHWVISHIDHEYILYSLDEYAERQLNPKIKGHDKLKTFKIDNARIPFDYRFRDRYFLFQVLDAYFENKALVLEYFSAAHLR